MSIVLVHKAEFARILGVTPARVSQLIAKGLPVLDNGKIEVELASRWLKSNTMPQRSRYPDRGCNQVERLKLN